MRKLNTLLCLTVAAAAMCAGSARAEVIELTNGSVLQGDVVAGRSDDTGLAVNVYETNGVVVIRWDHIEESRRKALRLELGYDLPEETVVMRPGHRVLLVSGETLVGFAENPRDDKPLRWKTKVGWKEYDRSALAGPVESTQVDGLVIFNVEELYQNLRDEAPPETAAENRDLAQKCINIGAYDHAKDHLAAAKAFPGLPDEMTKQLDTMLRQVEQMIRLKGAFDLKRQIQSFTANAKHNDAKKTLEALAEQYKDEAMRKEVGFDLLQTRTLLARNKYFEREVARDWFRVMELLIEAKCRETKPLKEPDPATVKPGASMPGTLAAARQWANRDLFVALTDRVCADLGLTKDELETYWKSRKVPSIKKASYNTGSFIVVKRAAKPNQPGGAPAERKSRPQGDKPGNKSPAGPRNNQVEKPKTDEEWWEARGPSDRKGWLTAYFVESSGLFDILRADPANCTACGGLGSITSTSSNGESESQFCVQCNGCGVMKSVSYR